MELKEKIIKANITKVIENRDIDLLNKTTYDFIKNIRGFISHYNMYGFKAEYKDFDMFIKKLLVSSEIENPKYYMDDFFMKDDKEYYTKKTEVLTCIKSLLNNQY